MNSSATLSRTDLTMELLTRFLSAIILTLTAWKVYNAFVTAPDATLLLALAGEILTIGLVIFARIPKIVNGSLFMFVISMASSVYFLVINVSTEQTIQLIPVVLAIMLQSVGFGMQVLAKLWLGRSFGVLPANRGIVTTGPYRWVRHPIYFGYFLNHLGFFLTHFSLWNLAIYAGVYAIQITRIVYEEKILMLSDAYAEYAKQVRYRFLPMIY